MSADCIEEGNTDSRIENLSALLRFVVGINQAIVREQLQYSLFRRICEVAIESGMFCMSWVGLIEKETGIIRPFCHAGHEDGYLTRAATITSRPVAEGSGPTGVAVREGRVVYCDDIASDPKMLPWREEAMKRGYRSSAAVPIFYRGEIIGTWNLYASFPGALGQDHIQMLTEISLDLSFAMESLTLQAERVQIMQELKESQDKFALFMEHMPGLAFIKDSQRRTIYVNSRFQEIFGIPVEEWLGKSNDELWPEDTARKIEQDDLFVLSNRKVLVVEETIPTKGEIRDYRAIKFPIPRVYEQPWLGGIIIDITEAKKAEEERKQLETRLLHAEKMDSVGRLAGGVAHDFNNNLSIIQGFVELIMEQTPAESAQFSQLLEVKKASLRSAELTKQLLTFARRQTISPEIIDLNEAIAETVRMLRRVIGENVELRLQPGKDLWSVEIDRSQLEQALINLCINARDAITGQGRIEVETSNVSLAEPLTQLLPEEVPPGDFVRLRVSDDGCGINPQLINNIFEPFFTTKKSGVGTGLGLSTIFGMVKQNSGYIQVESEEYRGTSFYIYLPRCSNAHQRKEEQVVESVPTCGSETILLVEDEPVLRELCQTVLAQNGYNVIVADNGASAIKRFQDSRERIDLLLTDINMPLVNGFELAREARQHNPDLNIMFMSGYPMGAINNDPLLDRDATILHKPFGGKDLLSAVQSVLACEKMNSRELTDRASS